jgi:hypothetical protein
MRATIATFFDASLSEDEIAAMIKTNLVKLLDLI